MKVKNRPDPNSDLKTCALMRIFKYFFPQIYLNSVNLAEDVYEPFIIESQRNQLYLFTYVMCKGNKLLPY
ncbi:hypothetical protein FLAT13_01054 [Flavobacterium salmonis]|uniref:Uncharacterized protein n=1 Tax=Flavobacterium salmonis TaxID=2654844 RepID=A0A6V6YS25_9FLAO|nr:hypothetical protein FLAT13_01054 [Flavobacterium salmonis]